MKKISLLPLFLSFFLLLFIPIRSIQFLSILIITLYALSFAISRYQFFSLHVQRERTLCYCPNRSDETLSFSVINKGFIPIDKAIIWDRANGCYGEGSGIFLDNVPARSLKRYTCNLLTDRRGKFKAGPVRIKGSDPLHLFPWEKSFNLFSHVVVYPAGHPLHLLLREGDRGGSVRADQLYYEDMTDLKGIRDYRRGDSLKRINWKASAKAGSLQTMEYSRNLSAPVLVLLDLTVSRYPLKHRHILMERAIEAAVSLIISYGESGQKVSLLTVGAKEEIFVPSRSGYGHMISVLEELAQAEFSDDRESGSLITSLYERGIKPVNGTHVSLLIPMLDDRLLNELNLLYRRKCQLQIIATGGMPFDDVPSFCRQYTLSEYGKEYFHV